MGEQAASHTTLPKTLRRESWHNHETWINSAQLFTLKKQFFSDPLALKGPFSQVLWAVRTPPRVGRLGAVRRGGVLPRPSPRGPRRGSRSARGRIYWEKWMHISIHRYMYIYIYIFICLVMCLYVFIDLFIFLCIYLFIYLCIHMSHNEHPGA